jgi:hypothetical protein
MTSLWNLFKVINELKQNSIELNHKVKLLEQTIILNNDNHNDNFKKAINMINMKGVKGKKVLELSKEFTNF